MLPQKNPYNPKFVKKVKNAENKKASKIYGGG
jgi:hypothetical protein